MAGLLWSLGGFFAKAPLLDGWPGPVLAFWRALGASCCLVFLIRKPSWSRQMVWMGLSFLAMNWCYLSAMVRMEASSAIWLQMTAPFWVYVLSPFLLHEHPSPRDRLSFWIGMVGVGFILVFELRGQQTAGVLYGLGSGLSYALTVMLLRKLRAHSATWLAAFNHFVVVVGLLPVVVSLPQYAPSGPQLVWVFLFGVLQMGLAYVLFAKGVQSVPGREAALIALIEPVLLPVWVYLAWHNHPSYQAPGWWTIVGGVLILVALVRTTRSAQTNGG